MVRLLVKLANGTKDIDKIDKEAQIDSKLSELTDGELRVYSNVVVPPRYCGAWTSLLYKRYLRWLAQSF